MNKTLISSKVAGLLIVSIAVIWQGFGTAVVGEFVIPELATFTTFSAFIAAAIIAAICLYVRNKSHPPAVTQLPAVDIIWMNVFTAGAFGCFYVSATLIPASAASVLETGLGPFIVTLISWSSIKQRLTKLIQPSLVLAVSAWVAYLSIIFHPGEHWGTNIFLGLVLGSISGICAAGVLIYSRRLSIRGISALQVSGIRFHLAWIFCGVITLMNGLDLNIISLDQLWYAAGIGVVYIAGPILLLQWGITKAAAIHSAMIISCLPALVLLGEVFLTGHMNMMILIGMITIACISVSGVIKGE